MRKSPTTVSFLWHMHQPYYRRPDEDAYLLPWTRLHAVKDYFGFAYLLSKFPEVKANFNFTPVLLDQILDYAQNNATDKFLELTKKNADYLTGKEKAFIVRRFFSVNQMRMIDPYPRYSALLQKSKEKKPGQFSAQEMRDLQMYFNLIWFHFTSIEEDKDLQELFKKGEGFTEDDKALVIAKQYAIIQKIVPLYKQLIDAGQVEICTSPYYHPILPLLCDTDIIYDFHNQPCPRIRFSYPEEALWHIREAKKRAAGVFGVPIQGSWPSEGSVSQEVLSLYKENDFKWLVTDEEILFRTLQPRMAPEKKLPRHIIYQPYRCKDMLIFFRDKNLSNALSFSYHGWQDLKAAAEDLLGHFKNIHAHTSSIYKKKIVLIAMDGENAWEYFDNNAKDFLITLYQGLRREKDLRSRTLSEFAKEGPFKKIDARLWPGSWINADFSVWAGSKENNSNWQLLARIKKILDRHKQPATQLEKATRYLRIIEGSDWNWWNTFEEDSGDFNKIMLSYVRELSKLLKTDFLKHK